MLALVHLLCIVLKTTLSNQKMRVRKSDGDTKSHCTAILDKNGNLTGVHIYLLANMLPFTFHKSCKDKQLYSNWNLTLFSKM